PLVGDARYWPEEVLLDGSPAVVAGGDVPMLQVPGPAGSVAGLERGGAGPDSGIARERSGRHIIPGKLAWDRLPDRPALPIDTGLVSLTLSGKVIDAPCRDQKGRLLLSGGAAAEGEKQSLEVVVHRRLTDEVPLEIETVIKLDVSGSGREVTIGPALLA